MKSNLKNLTLAVVAAAMCAGGLSQASAANIDVTSAIERSTFWTSNNVYILKDIIYVRSNATVTVEQGTTIKGESDANNPGTLNPATLIITRGSKIKLLGTEQHPIVMTDNGQYAPGDPKANRWGGFAICGRAFIARGTLTGADPLKEGPLEGLPAVGQNLIYGGGDDDDDSGVIRYVSIRNSGFGLSDANELNGLGLAAVGRETAMDHVEIYNNQDDGFEIWGGTINAKYLVAWNVGDDSFDFDEGYRGKLQFLLAVQGHTGASAATIGGGISDRGMELDGGGSPDQSLPYALWKAYNITVVGKGVTNDYDRATNNVALYMRDNGAGQIRNSVFLDFGGAVLHAEAEGYNGANNPTNVQQRFLTAWNDLPTGTISNSPANSYLYKSQTDGWQAEITSNVFYQFGGPLQNTAIADLVADANTDGASQVAGPQTADTTNVFANLPSGAGNLTASALPIVGYAREVSAAFAGFPKRLTAINPLAANDATNSPTAAPTDGFFTPVSYKGAFSPTNNWLAGWSYVSQLGLVASVANPPAPTISVVVTNTAPEISIPTEAGIRYSLESSYDMKHWHPITLIDGDGSAQVYVDGSGLTNRVQYRVVVP